MAYSVTIVNLVAAFLSLVLGVVSGKILGNIVKRFLKSLDASGVLTRELKLKIPVENWVAGAVKYFLYVIGFIYALNQVGISTRFLETIIVLVVLLIGVFVVLAVKDYVPNMIAGLYILRTQKLKAGDHITVKNITGEIIHIGLVETKVKVKNEVVFVPNAVLQKSEVTKREGL